MIAILIAFVGVASALMYLRRRDAIGAVLALAAGVGLAGVVGNYAMPSVGPRTVAVTANDVGAVATDLAGRIAAADSVSVAGDGLRAAQWRDLPARPLQWTPATGDTIELAFPRQLTLGRIFSLTLKRAQPGKARLQLLAENDQIIADVAGSDAALTVQWLPPVAEAMVLKARLFDAAGKVVAQGPVPLVVREAAPLQVQGRFGAPSFDAQVLDQLLANSHAILDWQVTLGKTVTRSETARVTMSEPNLLVVDAAYVEHLNPAARGAMLAQVAAGMPMIVLAANASDAALWSRELQLPLKAQAEDKAVGAPLAMSLAPLNPGADAAGAWTAVDKKVWARAWKKGRIVWLGLSDWHRYAISEPLALGLWWQNVLDLAGVQRLEDVVWLAQDELPVPGQRSEICAQGARGDVTIPELKQTIAWQRRADRADAACVAVWPRQGGWLTLQTQGVKPLTGQAYVYAANDWPAWQRAQRRAATADYAARTPTPPTSASTPLPAWPFALLFALAMFGLWWRERR